MPDIAGILAQSYTSAAHQKICNIVMAMCILSNLHSNVKTTESEGPKMKCRD